MNGWRRWAVLAQRVGLLIALLWIVNRGQGFSEPFPAWTVQQPWMPPASAPGEPPLAESPLPPQTPPSAAPPFTAPPPTPFDPYDPTPSPGMPMVGSEPADPPVPLVRLRSPRARFGPAR